MTLKEEVEEEGTKAKTPTKVDDPSKKIGLGWGQYAGQTPRSAPPSTVPAKWASSLRQPVAFNLSEA
ncbi:hypothetical protein NL438_26470, partial [Klebsiella pneumoniae]|nr:hypothetical protein [Klebsiella pneumoniae]